MKFDKSKSTIDFYLIENETLPLGDLNIKDQFSEILRGTNDVLKYEYIEIIK